MSFYPLARDLPMPALTYIEKSRLAGRQLLLDTRLWHIAGMGVMRECRRDLADQVAVDGLRPAHSFNPSTLSLNQRLHRPHGVYFLTRDNFLKRGVWSDWFVDYGAVFEVRLGDLPDLQQAFIADHELADALTFPGLDAEDLDILAALAAVHRVLPWLDYVGDLHSPEVIYCGHIPPQKLTRLWEEPLENKES